MEKIKVGDKVKTPRGYQGVVLNIYDDGRVLLEVGYGKLFGCSLGEVKKVEEK